MKTINSDEILRVVQEQLKKGESTTTLEVKEQLRNEGFWAKQEQVSKLMWDLYEEGKLECSKDSTVDYQKWKIPSSSSVSSPISVTPKSSGLEIIIEGLTGYFFRKDLFQYGFNEDKIDYVLKKLSTKGKIKRIIRGKYEVI